MAIKSYWQNWFAGVRQSGYGREKGQEAVLSYIRTKNVGVRIVDVDPSKS